MSDTPVSTQELEAWIEETRWTLSRTRSLQKAYLATNEADRRAFARRNGFVNLTDLNATLKAARERLAGYERALEKLRETKGGESGHLGDEGQTPY